MEINTTNTAANFKAATENTIIPKKKSFLRRMMKWIFILLFIWLAVWFVGGTYIIVDSKFRSGNVVKFGKDGWLLRTYEGTLRMGGGEGMMNTDRSEFDFSVADKAMIDALEKVDTRRTVKLWYDKTLFALPWRGNTKYYIVKMEVMPDLFYNPQQQQQMQQQQMQQQVAPQVNNNPQSSK
jgi:hypothetical protein